MSLALNYARRLYRSRLRMLMPRWKDVDLADIWINGCGVKDDIGVFNEFR